MPNKVVIAFLAALVVVACGHATPPTPVAAVSAAPAAPVEASSPESPFKLTAGITDIMKYEIDPSADALWDSVGTYVTRKGTENRQPHTPEQWSEARGHALILTEAANLLMMARRRVATEGEQTADQGTPGNLTAEQAQAAIDKNRTVFVSFAQALHDVGEQMVQAADKKDANALMDAGAALDEVCESCHLKFWYPGQNK